MPTGTGWRQRMSGTTLVGGVAAYSFPQNTTVLDNFNRANEGPPPSANWVTFGGGDLQVSSNQLKGLNSASYGRWSASSFAANQEVWMTISTKPASTQETYLYLRMPVTDNGNGYFLDYTTAAGTDTWEIYKGTPGSVLITSAVTGPELAAGDKIGFNAVGNVLTGYAFQSGVWTQVITGTDSTYTGAGYIGLLLTGSTVRVDDFGGGSIV